MRKTDCPVAAYTEHPIWVALSHHVIGPPEATLPFTERLARENGWTPDHAARVVEEYKRFCFLAVTAGHAVTPSDAVDQAWHLHLTYSRDYWEHFCPSVLGRPLHHEPTTGEIDARHRYFRQYAETLKSYERTFGESSPADLWPTGAQRLLDDPKARRIHPREGFFVTPRRAILFVLAACCLFAAFIILS